MKALLIEDDPEIVDSVSMALRMRWPSAKIISTGLGEEGVDLAESENPEIIILDLGLPDLSGFEVLRQIRLSSSVPIIILTVRGEETDIVKGLELGADDYISKPCGQLEILARVHAKIRDGVPPPGEAAISFGPLQFDPVSRHLVYADRDIRLTAIEARIIHHLMRNGGRVATYAALSQDLWGDEYPGSVDSLRVHVRRLRTKIEVNPSHPRHIFNEPGVGYFLARKR